MAVKLDKAKLQAVLGIPTVIEELNLPKFVTRLTNRWADGYVVFEGSIISWGGYYYLFAVIRQKNRVSTTFSRVVVLRSKDIEAPHTKWEWLRSENNPLITPANYGLPSVEWAHAEVFPNGKIYLYVDVYDGTYTEVHLFTLTDPLTIETYVGKVLPRSALTTWFDENAAKALTPMWYGGCCWGIYEGIAPSPTGSRLGVVLSMDGGTWRKIWGAATEYSVIDQNNYTPLTGGEGTGHVGTGHFLPLVMPYPVALVNATPTRTAISNPYGATGSPFRGCMASFQTLDKGLIAPPSAYLPLNLSGTVDYDHAIAYIFDVFRVKDTLYILYSGNDTFLCLAKASIVRRRWVE